MDDNKLNIKGIIGTVVFHGILLAILLAFAFTPAPLEFPEPDGIQVNFGELVEGDDAAGTPQQEQLEIQPKINPDETSPSNLAENVVTQNTQDAAYSVKPDNKPKETKPEPTPEELERLRKEEAIKKQQQALFNQNFAGNGGNNGQKPGPPGNSTNGKPGGNPGNPGGGQSLNVKGMPGNPFGNKDAIHLVKPINTKNCNKLVSLTVKINSMGKVIAITDIESAESEQACIEAAKRAAMSTTFKADANMTVRYGKINYEYTTSKN